MKNLSKKVEFARLNFAVLAMAFVCIGLFGCSDDEFKWYDGYVGAEVVGFVDDSLVIVGDYQLWKESHEGMFEPYWDVEGSGHERLCVYNYRVQETGPRWCEQLDDEKTTGAFAGQMTDSIIWGRGLPNKLKMWKIGESQHEIKLSKSLEGCSTEFGISSIHQWLDGKFIARGDKSLSSGGCQYAVLDTVARTITYKRLDENLEWMKMCDDVRAWGEDVYCLIFDKVDGRSVLLKDATDSIFAPMEKLYEGCFSGNMLELGVRICSLINDEIVCSDVKWTGNQELEFYKNDGTVIYLK